MSNPNLQGNAGGVRVLAPARRSAEWLDELIAAGRRSASMPFTAERVRALESLSQGLLRHPELRRDPAAVALAFWLRRANLSALRETIERAVVPGHRVPAGLVFHIAPANVDTMFVYSWALSFLAGNANVVRLTTRGSALMEVVLDCIAAVIADDEAAAEGNAFVTYPHEHVLTERLSLACDARIVWGGDETVKRLRAVPLNPHATERSFASKRSLSVMAAEKYLSADDITRDRIAGSMAADIAPFGQMACSSPHVVYWIGSHENGRRAIEDFSHRVEMAMEGKAGAPDLGYAVRRINFAFNAAVGGSVGGFKHQPHTSHLRNIANPPEEPCGGGLLTHAVEISTGSLSTHLSVQHQSITYFGLEADELTSLAQSAGQAGVDRIVPIGKALDFGPFWDGYCLWDDLTRVVVVE